MLNRKSYVLGIVAIAVLCLVPTGEARAAMETWGLVDDWSDATPSFHDWQLGFTGGAGYQPTGAFSVYSQSQSNAFGITGQSAWNNTDDGVPFALKSIGAFATSTFPPDFPAGTIGAYSWQDPDVGTFRWTAPRATTINISGTTWDADWRGPRGCAVGLIVNGMLIFGQNITDQGSPSEPLTFADLANIAGSPSDLLGISVNAGDIVDITVPGLGSNSAVGFGDIVITEVPEPASLCLLGLGGLALLRRRR